MLLRCQGPSRPACRCWEGAIHPDTSQDAKHKNHWQSSSFERTHVFNKSRRGNTPYTVLESAGHDAPVALGGGGCTGEASTASVIRHVDRLKLPRSQVDTAELVDRAARSED